ncbi:hypothetical protein [Roseibium aggregatum]|uniref:Uncharacterized protein n=1 Tax=Roseibium aggregatum TaxID=187304 RepID=A0A926P1P0_9HYPH|nr:hypothetical protein [Roseibium aggregatum]MBD1547833.1 hypothetical protein [Roseibium aggregatum]
MSIIDLVGEQYAPDETRASAPFQQAGKVRYRAGFAVCAGKKLPILPFVPGRAYSAKIECHQVSI